eukprot:symbB.v1.2.014261.t1/scaffold1023.1/size143418/5
MAMEVLDLLYTRRERPRAKSLADFFAKQVKGDVVNGLEPRSFKLEHGMLNHATVTVWSRGLIVGCGLGGVVNDMDWKEPRSVLFAVLDAEAFEAAQKEEALDVGRGLALVPEEQIMGTGVKALAISVPNARLAPASGHLRNSEDLGHVAQALRRIFTNTKELSAASGWTLREILQGIQDDLQSIQATLQRSI